MPRKYDPKKPKEGSADYEVGYKKPPRHTQFKKGHTPAPKKRRRAKAGSSAALDVLNRKVSSGEGGQQVTVSQVIATRMAKDAANGSVRAASELRKWAAEEEEQIAAQGMTPEEIVAEREEKTRREETAKRLADGITDWLQTAARLKKSRVLETGPDGNLVVAQWVLEAAKAREQGSAA